MTLKELMLGNIQSNQGAAAIQIGAQTAGRVSGKNEKSAFANILGSRLSSVDRPNSMKRNEGNVSAGRKNTEPLDDRTGNKPGYLSFREARKSSSSISDARSKTKVGENDHSQPEDVEEAGKNRTRNQTRDNMLYVFAQLLGMDMGELQKLLKEAGITPEAFSDMQNAEENASRLSQLLGLDTEQADTLEKILRLTGESLDALAAVQSAVDGEGINPQEGKSGASAKTGELSGVEIVSETSAKQEALQSAASLESLAARLNLKIKVKLNELGNKLENDQGAVAAELNQLTRPISGKGAGEIQDHIQPAPGTDTAEAAGITAIKAEEAAEEGKSAGEGANSGAEMEKAAPQATVKEASSQATFAAIQQAKVNGAENIEKTAAKMPVADKEIISQVIEKAKVILTSDKSEMLMELKPDSLGRISLKVVTENGIVMAKFVADSQQVKQVLEANMQLLKDSLEKQGMNVQGFSVSVRQDSNRPSENWTKPETGRNRSISGAAYRTEGIEGSLTGIMESVSGSNPYNWSGSTINLTA